MSGGPSFRPSHSREPSKDSIVSYKSRDHLPGANAAQGGERERRVNNAMAGRNSGSVSSRTGCDVGRAGPTNISESERKASKADILCLNQGRR